MFKRRRIRATGRDCSTQSPHASCVGLRRHDLRPLLLSPGTVRRATSHQQNYYNTYRYHLSSTKLNIHMIIFKILACAALLSVPAATMSVNSFVATTSTGYTTVSGDGGTWASSHPCNDTFAHVTIANGMWVAGTSNNKFYVC